MSMRLSLALSRALLCSALVPAALIVATPSVAQTKLAPDNHVMEIRLQGTWQNDHHQFIFEPRPGGVGGKAALPGLLFRKIERATGKELERGTLVPDLANGLLRGEVREGPASPVGYSVNREMKAWVDDRGRLWMDGFNATPDGRLYDRVPTMQDDSAAATWVGKWRTNRGAMEVVAEGRNFAAFILAEDGSRRDRVAFKADVTQASGAWDSEYDAQGKWLHKPARWGDLGLTRSADGKSFTGWYSAPKAGGLGLERREWTGQRTDRSEPSQTPGSLDAVAEKLKGQWFTPFGPIEMREERAGNRTEVGAQVTDGQGVHRVFYIPQGPGLFQIVRGVNNIPSTFVIAADGQSFDVEGTGTGVNGAWRATRADPYTVRSQPTAEQATLLRVLEGRWRERDSDSQWRFPIGGQSGLVDAATWRAADGEAAATPAPFGPTADGRSLVARFANGNRVLIERNSNGEIFLVRPQQGLVPRWSTQLIKLTNAPAEPAPSSPIPRPGTPRPSTPPPAPSQPAPTADDAFQPLGRWDVRLDRVEMPRDDRLVHVYLTLRNAGTTKLLQTGNVTVYLEDSSGGGAQQSGQGLRALPGPAQLFGSPPPEVFPGKEIKTKYIFDRLSGATISKITIREGEEAAEFEF